MSTIDNQKLITERFLENAINDGKIEDVVEKQQNESEQHISDEISNEMFPETPKDVPINIDKPHKPETRPIQPSKIEKAPENVSEDAIENFSEETPESLSEKVKEDTLGNLSEETESARDFKSSERDLSDEEDKRQIDSFEEKEEIKEEWQDILGSGIIMKKILKEGVPDTRPNRSEKCFINYTCRLEDGDEDDFVEKIENYELGLGEGDVIQGLDVALGLMNKHERCLLKIGSRLAYGERGFSPNIPGNSTVMIDVELVDVKQEKDFENMSVQERRQMGNKKRERGNWWYQRGENTLAVQCYRRALDFLDEVESESKEHAKPTDSELQALLEDRLKVLNNMASAQIKMELYDQALTSLQTVLRCQPDNVKALFRKSKIYAAKNDLPQALKLLEKARTLEPEDTLIAKEISTISGLIAKQKNSEREYARRMFGGVSPTESSNKATVGKDKKKSRGSKVQVWATIGATVVIGLAGVIAYKFKYP